MRFCRLDLLLLLLLLALVTASYAAGGSVAATGATTSGALFRSELQDTWRGLIHEVLQYAAEALFSFLCWLVTVKMKFNLDADKKKLLHDAVTHEALVIEERSNHLIKTEGDAAALSASNKIQELTAFAKVQLEGAAKRWYLPFGRVEVSEEDALRLARKGVALARPLLGQAPSTPVGPVG